MEQEIQALKEILSIPVTSKAERLEKEAKLDQVLPQATNAAITALYGDRYATREFETRIMQGSQFELSFIFSLADRYLSGATFTTKSEKALDRIISQAIANSAPTVSRKDFEILLIRYANTVLDANTSYLEQAISFRDDLDDIVKGLKEYAHKNKLQYLPDWYLESLINRAIGLKNSRQE